VVDLARARPAEVVVGIEAEATRLSGLAEAAMRRAYVRLKPVAEYHNPFWLTLCKADEVEGLLDRYGHAFAGEEEARQPPPVAAVFTTAQALLAAVTTFDPVPANAVLIALGTHSTTIAIRAAEQAMFATSLPRGSSEFAASPLPGAETSAVAQPETGGAGRGLLEPASLKAIERWHGDVKLVLSEWLEDHPLLGLSLATLPVYLTGGGSAWPGLIATLNPLGSLQFNPWPPIPGATGREVGDDFVVAYGAALLGFGPASQRVSLLPAELEHGRLQQRVWEGVQAGVLALLLVLSVLLAFGTWQQTRLLIAKNRLGGRTAKAVATAAAMDLLYRRLNVDYERMRPILVRQRQTAEALGALAAVEHARTNDDFWLVSFGDAASYAAGTTLPEPVTNRPPGNAAPVVTPSPAPPPGRREFVAELCIPSDGEAMRRTLSQVVADLKQSDWFNRVDALPPERKRTIVDPRVVLSNHVFAVSMELAGEELSLPVGLTPRPAVPRDPRRVGVPARTRAEGGFTPEGRSGEGR
jgi:broad specificity phosphatase PhoE